MHYGEWTFWGMHFFWWIFWVMALITLFSPNIPTRVRKAETYFDLLKRRYANGEIDSKEYEKCKEKLKQEIKLSKN